MLRLTGFARGKAVQAGDAAGTPRDCEAVLKIVVRGRIDAESDVAANAIIAVDSDVILRAARAAYGYQARRAGTGVVILIDQGQIVQSRAAIYRQSRIEAAAFGCDYDAASERRRPAIPKRTAA